MSFPRKHIRFSPDPTDYIKIDTQPSRSSFKAEYVGLIIDEAPMGGCGMACLNSIPLQVGDIVALQVGRLEPLRSEIVWVRDLDDKIRRFGIRFLE